MDNKLRSFLLDWTSNFIKNKDIVSRKIEKIESNKDNFDLYVKYKDKGQFFIIAPTISDIDSIAQRADNTPHLSIVTLNSKQNFDVVMKNWSKLANFKFLSIMFINPFSELEKKWIIFPYTHNRVCDESSLENGLKSMFNMVEQIDEEQLTAKLA